MAKIFITGIAGFIGSSLALSLVKDGHIVSGIDDFNEYYDSRLKKARAFRLSNNGIEVDTGDYSEGNYRPYHGPYDIIVHLAAYAGVRHSVEKPHYYIDNITKTQRMITQLELLSKECNVNSKVVYASTSCVMAGNPLPWKEDMPVHHQLNPYGWSKHVNECQFINSKIKDVVGLRFFTVYGPWGRPDMALFKFTDAISKGEPIDLFNFGQMKRDWTYIDDIVQGIKIVMFENTTRGEIFNIGRGVQVNLMDFVSAIEDALGKKATINYIPRHPADTLETWSDTSKLQALGYVPSTDIKDGVQKFVRWYKDFYRS